MRRVMVSVSTVGWLMVHCLTEPSIRQPEALSESDVWCGAHGSRAPASLQRLPVRRVNSLVRCPCSYVVLVDPDGLSRCRHPDLIEREWLPVWILEPVHLTIPGRGDVSFGHVEGVVSYVENASSFGDEPDVAGSHVIVRCGGVSWTVGDVIRLEVGETE